MAELINNIDEIKRQFLEACENAINEIGITGTAELQSNSPVKEGFLRRSLTFKKLIYQQNIILHLVVL